MGPDGSPGYLPASPLQLITVLSSLQLKLFRSILCCLTSLLGGIDWDVPEESFITLGPDLIRSCVMVPIIDDDEYEPTETFIAFIATLLPFLDDPFFIDVDQRVATIEILDNDSKERDDLQ